MGAASSGTFFEIWSMWTAEKEMSANWLRLPAHWPRAWSNSEILLTCPGVGHR